MQVSAWHSNHDFMSTIHLEKRTPEIKLGETHGLLPITFEVAGIDVDHALNKAFDLFNWVHVDFAAPTSVNEFAGKFNSHASMSVGDIVEIDGKFWYCEPMGWSELPTLTHPEQPIWEVNE